MAKSKQEKQQEALARKRALYPEKLKEYHSRCFGGETYLEIHAAGLDAGRFFQQEAKRVFEKYLEEAQLDEHGNPFSRRDHSWANHSTKFRQDNYSIHDHLKEVIFTDDRYVEK
jgi:hypothetical protein